MVRKTIERLQLQLVPLGGLDSENNAQRLKLSELKPRAAADLRVDSLRQPGAETLAVSAPLDVAYPGIAAAATTEVKTLRRSKDK